MSDICKDLLNNSYLCSQHKHPYYIVLPKHLADVVVLWASAVPGTFVLECLAAQEEMAVEAEIKEQDELSFEIFEPREDKKAGIF